MVSSKRGVREFNELSYCAAVAFLLAVSVVSGTGIIRHYRGAPTVHAVLASTLAPQVQAPPTTVPSRNVGATVIKESPPPVSGGSEFNVYANALTSLIRPDLAGIPERVYVPNSTAGMMDVIDPRTYQVVAHIRTGQIPYHVTPAWDMKRLYIDNEGSGSLQVLDPATTAVTGTVAVPHPYNLYFTPDGSTAIIVDERQGRLLFADPVTWAIRGQLDISWRGVDHLDFSADGSYLLASCEFTGVVAKVDVQSMSLVAMASVGGLPIDVRLSPDGSVFYVANQGRGGVSILDPVAMKEVGFIPTGRGAHGLQLSRDTRSLYVSNRLAGTISVIDVVSRAVSATWTINGSPDMMQISPDGQELWASARFDHLVYVINTASGAVMHRIAVGSSPHGLSYFPSPGRFSLGHNGVYR